MKRALDACRVLAMAVVAVAGIAAQTGEPAAEPTLRIETGMHTAGIYGIGVDRAGTFLVTASQDKTARVWEVATGKLLRVLRVPIGDGHQGELYATAISPDGNTIGAGGWTSVDGLDSLYLFDRESGGVVRRLTGLPHFVDHLTFSPDGTRLVATLGGRNGVRQWRTSDWTEVGRDAVYGGISYGADFDRAGRLVTSSDDGSLRLYDRDMHLLKKRDAPGGKHPRGVRFSPDGQKIAVGYGDSTKVDVVSGDALAPLYSADTSGVGNGDLGSVAWSVDGTLLYAGGRYQSHGAHVVRRWSDAGRGGFVDAAATGNTIRDLAPLPSGGLVFGAADPAWGVFDARHQRVRLQAGPIADYRGMLASFLTDATGSTVRFGYEPFGKSPAAFHLANRTLVLELPAGGDLRPPRTAAPGIDVTDWKDADTPRVNSTLLTLGQGETSRSLAIAPDGARFVLGTDFYIRLFNLSGQEVWHVPAPGVARSVNISGDGRVALASYGDGTIRWYRLTDGKELLAFFPHADRKRWVLWTPTGYYDASPGAEDLIGWHVNTGKDRAADFFPAGQFRATFYRPDVVARILETAGEVAALRLANDLAGRRADETKVARMLPPVVEIVSPANDAVVSTPSVTVRFRVRTPPDDPLTRIKTLVDGRPWAPERGMALAAQAADVRQVNVDIPRRDSEISIIAENRSAASVPATVRVRWHSAATPEAFVAKPMLYVLAIGVSKYDNPDLTLGFAAKDARDFAGTLAKQKGGLYRDVVIKVLADEHATKDAILDGLEWITRETTSRDVAMVFLAGHGVNDPIGQYYFLPANADTGHLKRTGVAFSDIKSTVEALAGKTLFFVDTCHSGNVLGGKQRGQVDINGIVNELASAENGAVVFAASSGNQSSLEEAGWGNGAFTKALVEAMNGAADYGKQGKITINMLDLYISERVKVLTKGRQTPTTTKPQTVADFPVVIKQ